uniref:Uncharacterized protein n=1 Tax=Ixodes ricinus TaxID=34613 RepID=A0A6B0UTK7_IXORI
MSPRCRRPCAPAPAPPGAFRGAVAQSCAAAGCSCDSRGRRFLGPLFRLWNRLKTCAAWGRTSGWPGRLHCPRHSNSGLPPSPPDPPDCCPPPSRSRARTQGQSPEPRHQAQRWCVCSEQGTLCHSQCRCPHSSTSCAGGCC